MYPNKIETIAVDSKFTQHVYESLNIAADRLSKINRRIAEACDRAFGQGPECPSTTDAVPQPNGSIGLINFTIKEIDSKLSQLETQVTSIERII